MEIRLLNEYNVKKVHWESREVECFCPLGNDWCTHKFVVDVECGRYIFDLYKLDDWITENIKGQQMTMEQSAHALYKFLVYEIEPTSISVKEYNGIGGYIVEI